MVLGQGHDWTIGDGPGMDRALEAAAVGRPRAIRELAWKLGTGAGASGRPTMDLGWIGRAAAVGRPGATLQGSAWMVPGQGHDGTTDDGPGMIGHQVEGFVMRRPRGGDRAPRFKILHGWYRGRGTDWTTDDGPGMDRASEAAAVGRPGATLQESTSKRRPRWGDWAPHFKIPRGWYRGRGIWTTDDGPGMERALLWRGGRGGETGRHTSRFRMDKAAAVGKSGATLQDSAWMVSGQGHDWTTDAGPGMERACSEEEAAAVGRPGATLQEFSRKMSGEGHDWTIDDGPGMDRASDRGGGRGGETGRHARARVMGQGHDWTIDDGPGMDRAQCRGLSQAAAVGRPGATLQEFAWKLDIGAGALGRPTTDSGWIGQRCRGFRRSTCKLVLGQGHMDDEKMDDAMDLGWIGLECRGFRRPHTKSTETRRELAWKAQGHIDDRRWIWDGFGMDMGFRMGWIAR
ncbi:hypothetical protein D9615_007732 [Tricholomella constricta]|uniref:Uncharacterized protein n=1 Tax=Tricholomella constricta TaxID=117010 RepID=A0A8H5M089_9AGAR|nr:hypothetical protein D9615_007732 [Tricholomella constricta]